MPKSSLAQRWLMAVVVVTALGMAFLLWSKSRGDEGVAATATLAERVVEPPRPSSPPTGLDAAVEPHVAEAERTAVPEDDDESRLPQPRPGTGKVWKGKVEFVGLGREFGTTLEERDLGINRLTLGFECFGRTYPEVVELSFDTFECVVPYADEDIERVRVVRASAQGGHWVPAVGSESLAPEFDAPVVVRLVRPPSTVLNVVDARTGELLDGFRLSTLDVSAEAGWSVTFGKGPVTTEMLPFATDSEGLLQLRVSAEGWASRTIELNLDAGGKHEIRMQRGGTVQVNWTVPEELRAVIWSTTDRPALYVQLRPTRRAESARNLNFEEPTSTSFGAIVGRRDRKTVPSAEVEATVKDVAPGEYRAAMQAFGSGLTRPRELAAGTVTVRADEATEVELTTLPELDFPAPEWTFEVVVPPEYPDVRKLSIRVDRSEPIAGLDTSNRAFILARETEPRVWQSAAIRADPGTYRVGVSIDGTCAVDVELAGSSETPIRVVLPVPRRYLVRLRSRRSELPPLPRSLYFRASPSLEDVRGERVDQSKGTYEILASGPAIEISVPARGSMRLAEGEWVRLEGGGEHVLDVIPGPCVRLVLHENGQPCDTPRSFTLVRARGPDGRRRPLDSRRVQPSPGAAHELLLWFREPGEHQLELGEISGFEPIAPLNVTVTEGPERIVPIDLVRKR